MVPKPGRFFTILFYLKTSKKPSWFFVDFNPSIERIKGDFEIDYAK